MDLKQHWDKVFSRSPTEKLGWYETEVSPTLRLVEEAGLDKQARILNVGAGTTTLVDALLNLGYRHILATDISEVALNNLRSRVGNEKVTFILDDLTNPQELLNQEGVNLWIDRAVLHFFTEEKEQNSYFSLLKKLVSKSGYVLFAQFSLNGAEKCSGLPVCRYCVEGLQEKLGKDFKLIDCFDYTYTMPSGDLRPYVYALFQQID